MVWSVDVGEDLGGGGGVGVGGSVGGAVRVGARVSACVCACVRVCVVSGFLVHFSMAPPRVSLDLSDRVSPIVSLVLYQIK